MKVINSFLKFFYIFFSDSNFRELILKPFRKSIKTFLVIVVSVIILSYLSCEYASSYMSLNTGGYAALIVGNLLFVILIPPIITFLYFSFFCESEYQEIARFPLRDVLEKSNNSPTISKSALLLSSGMRISVMTVLLLLSLVVSLGMPFLGLVMTGFILVWDFFNYATTELEFSFSKEVSFFWSNVFSSLLLSVIFGFLCLVPFLILLIYPIGVFVCADVVRKTIVKE